MKNFVSFLLTNFQLFFLLRFDMSVWQLFDSMFLKNEGKYNELFFPTTMYPLLNFVLTNEMYFNNLQGFCFVMTIVLNLTDEYYNF